MSHPIDARNFVDRAIEAVWPTWAARRYASRAAISYARSMPAASYRGAVSTRTSTGWNSPSTSFRGGSVADRRDLADMRDRGRRVYRENVIGRSLMNTETDNVVGDGYTLQMRTMTPEFNAEAEDRFAKWLERADIAGKMCSSELFRVSWSESRRDGDGGFVLISRGGYPYLQWIPGDLIRNPYGRFDFRTMFDGVECDPSGRPQRFWIRDVDQAGKDVVNPIDAQDFVYLAHLDDAIAIRGATVYGPIFEHLDQISGYIDSVAVAARMACIFGLIEKRKNPSMALSGLASQTNSKGDLQKAVTLENGMLKVIGTDDSIFQVQAQQPMQQAPDFMRAMFRIAALQFDMPIELAAHDLSQVNFSGGRIGLVAFYRSCRIKQSWHKSRCWNRIAYWWLSKERQRQQLGYADAFKTPFPDDYGKFELIGQEWSYNDPQTEAAAKLLEISAGLNSPQRACAELNRDYDTIQRELATFYADRVRDKIPVVLSALTRDRLSPPPTPPTLPTDPPPDQGKQNAG